MADLGKVPCATLNTEGRIVAALRRVSLLNGLVLLVACFQLGATQFAATPVTDGCGTSAKYLNKFPYCLYNDTNSEPPAAHDAYVRSQAAAIQPLDGDGNPSATGKIGIAMIGFSSWSIEVCRSSLTLSLVQLPCNAVSIITAIRNAQEAAQVNPSITMVDCAQGRQSTPEWAGVPDTIDPWPTCEHRLTQAGLTAKQIQVIWFKNADLHPSARASLSALPGNWCGRGDAATIDACYNEQELGAFARLAKSKFPNTRILFMHTRVYAGYVPSDTANPEPYAYEYAFPIRAVINAQTQQADMGGAVDRVAGDLSYSHAPAIVWGPYFWASGQTPRLDGLAWLPTDYYDGLHLGQPGVNKLINLMMPFYETSPYSAPWFLP